MKIRTAKILVFCNDHSFIRETWKEQDGSISIIWIDGWDEGTTSESLASELESDFQSMINK